MPQTPYFQKFPQILYDIDGTGTNVRQIIDIIHRTKFLSSIISNTAILYPYTVQDGDTPEIIADKLYGSCNYFWVVMLANDMFDRWGDWPLDYFQFQAYIIKKYGSVVIAQNTIDHYEDQYGNVVDQVTYNNSLPNYVLYATPDEVINLADISISLVDAPISFFDSGPAFFYTYYIDPVNGNDSLDESTPQSAWQTITRADSVTLYEGQSIGYNTNPSTNLALANYVLYATPDEIVSEGDIETGLVGTSISDFDTGPTLQTSGQNYTYYIDPVNGTDSNDGLSPQTPWATTTRANRQTLYEGQSIGYNINPNSIFSNAITVVYAMDQEFNFNESKKQILLLEASYVSLVEAQLDALMVSTATS